MDAGPLTLNGDPTMTLIETATPSVADPDSLALWATVRREGLGASESAAALGFPEAFKDPLALWAEKTGNAAAEPLDDPIVAERLYWGHRHEATLRAEVEKRLPVVALEASTPADEGWPSCVRVADCRDLGVVFRSLRESLGWLRATPDGFLRTTEELTVGERKIPTGTTLLLEIKTSGAFVRSEWEDGPPEHYLAQVWHSLAVFDLPLAVVAVLIGGNEFRTYLVERLDPDAEIGMLEGLEAFWKLVEEETPPAPPESGSPLWSKRLASLKRLHPDDDSEPVVLEADLIKLLKRRETLLRQVAERKAEIDEIEAMTREAMGPKAYGISPKGDFVVTLKTTERAGYVAEVKPSKFRTLRITAGGKKEVRS